MMETAKSANIACIKKASLFVPIAKIAYTPFTKKLVVDIVPGTDLNADLAYLVL